MKYGMVERWWVNLYDGIEQPDEKEIELSRRKYKFLKKQVKLGNFRSAAMKGLRQKERRARKARMKRLK